VFLPPSAGCFWALGGGQYNWYTFIAVDASAATFCVLGMMQILASVTRHSAHNVTKERYNLGLHVCALILRRLSIRLGLCYWLLETRVRLFVGWNEFCI
jgi:hypothetical protein